MHTRIGVVVLTLALLFIGTVFINTHSAAQDPADGAGTAGAAFLKIEPGTRPVGMGGAFTGLANDINTIFWNPAGLTAIQTRELTAMQHFWIADISSQSIGYAQRTHNIVWGASLVGSFTEISRRTGPSETPDSTTTVGGFATGLSIAYPLGTTSSIGGTAKFLSQQLDIQNVFGTAVDFGFITHLFANRLGIGLTLHNAGMFFEDATRDANLPTEYPPLALRAGLAYKLSKTITLDDAADTQQQPFWAFAADIHLPLLDAHPSFHFGLERWFYNSIAARIGYRLGRNENPNDGLSIGISIKKQGLDALANIGFQFDYAFVPQTDIDSNSHRIALITRF